MTLSSEVISICKATAPVLKEHGLAITQKFYENLFDNHPYVNNLFRVHVEEGMIIKQQQSGARRACRGRPKHMLGVEVIYDERSTRTFTLVMVNESTPWRTCAGEKTDVWPHCLHFMHSVASSSS